MRLFWSRRNLPVYLALPLHAGDLRCDDADSHHDVSPPLVFTSGLWSRTLRGTAPKKGRLGPFPVGSVRSRDAKQKPGDAPTTSSDFYNHPGKPVRVRSAVFCSFKKPYFTQVANKQQLPGDLSAEFRGLRTLSGWLWMQSDINNDNDSFLRVARVASPCWAEGEGRRRGGVGGLLRQNKSLFLVSSKKSTCDWWDSAASGLQLTLPTAMETLSFLKQWRKCRPCKFSHV